MTITQSQSNQPASVFNMAVGSYITDGTAAAITLTLGFQARYVRVVNETSGDQIEWFEGMEDAEGFKRVAAGTGAMVTSSGITVGESTIIIGLDTDINVTNEQLSWLAIG